jgi:hypothetical protein
MFRDMRLTQYCVRYLWLGKALLCVGLICAGWANASEPVVQVDLSSSKMQRSSVVNVDFGQRGAASPDKDAHSVIDLKSPSQRTMTLDLTDFRYRTPQTETRWGHHSAQLWGQCLVALAAGDMTVAKARLNDWMTDWQQLPDGDEKIEALQLLGTQLSRLGIYPWADKVTQQWCTSSRQCESLTEWRRAFYPSPWSDEALNQYLTDVGNTLAMLYKSNSTIQPISPNPAYPDAQAAALTAWRKFIQDDLKTAAQQYQKAQQLSSSDPFLSIALGQVYAKQQRWGLATQAFQKAQRVLSESSYGQWAHGQTTTLLNGYLNVVQGEAKIAQGRSYSGRTLQMDGYELLGRYPEMMGHIQQYHCLTVGPAAHRLWAANIVQQYGLWPNTVSRLTPRYFRQSDLKYTAALLQARHHKLTGTVKQAEADYRQLAQLQPNRQESFLGLSEIDANGGSSVGEVGFNQVSTLEKNAWLQSLSDDLMDKSQETLAQAKAFRDLASQQEHSPASTWTLTEKQYVGQALRYAFLSKYILGNTASQLTETLSSKGMGVSMRLSLHEDMVSFLERERAELATLARWHQQLTPPKEWELVHDLMTDIHSSHQRNLQQFASTLSPSSTSQVRHRTVQALFQIAEQKQLTFLLDQHLFKAIRALPEEERQRWLFEYELPIEPAEIKQMFMTVDEELVSSISVTARGFENSSSKKASTVSEKTTDQVKADKSTRQKRASTQRLRAMMGLPTASK